ncbi:MAG: PqiC family protein [Opitutus sp.]
MNVEPMLFLSDQKIRRAASTPAPSTASGGVRSWTRRMKGVTAGMLLAVVSACSLPHAQPDLTRFYLLNEVMHKADVTEVVGEPPRIVLRPVIVPEYLRGRIMQVRVGDNELRFIDQARWAEPLEAGMTRVLREDLSQRPARVRVVARGVDEHEFDVAVNLRRCEGLLPAGAARLAARIEIFVTGTESKLVAQEDFSFDVPGWDGTDYGQLAKKLSGAADALTERIVSLLPASKA